MWLLDRLAIATALFGFFVRFGNFFNSEILGTQVACHGRLCLNVLI